MLEDGLNGVTSAPTETETPAASTESEQPIKASTEAETNPPADRTFTRDEVTTIVKKRIERAENKLLGKFGIENKDKIQEYLDNHNKSLKDLEDLTGKYGELEGQFKSLNREHLYLKNNIIPDKYGDLDKQFTDDLTEEKLIEVLKKHPEFIKPKVVVPETLGSTKEGNKTDITEQQMAEKLFGVKFG